MLRWKINTDPMRDIQQQPPVEWCARCGCELYPYDEGEICEKCKEDMENDENWNEQAP